METSFPKPDNFKSWNPLQVAKWLNENGFKEYSDFFVEHQITGDLLLDLDYTTLKDIGVIVVGDRARILQAIKKQFVPKLPKIKTTSFPSVYSSVEDKGRKSAEISASSSPKLSRRPVNNISTSSGALKSQARELFQAKSANRLVDPSRDIYQRNLRKPRTGSGTTVKPITIFPRSSSIKEKSNTPHQQYSDALESVFGSGSRDDPPSPARLEHSKDARDKLLREVIICV
jgi:SAM domain (Sterile alpha motif)